MVFIATAPCYADVTLQEIETGITEKAVISREKASGFRISRNEQNDQVYISNPQTNQVIKTIRICNGLVYSYSTDLEGGIESFIKRISQFNNIYGKPETDATTTMTNYGELNSLEVTWMQGKKVVVLSFTSASSGIAESQWLQYGVPSICKQIQK